MALVAADLRDVMIAALTSITGDGHTAQDALDLLADSIETYIMDNAAIAFSWNGVQAATPFGSENTTPSGEIQGLSISLSPSMATPEQGQTFALAHLSDEIITGVSAATYNITDSGYATSPLPLSSAPTIDSLVTSITGITVVDPPAEPPAPTPQEQAHLQLAQCIIDYITGLAPTAPVLGTHGTFSAPTGTGGTVTAIS